MRTGILIVLLSLLSVFGCREKPLRGEKREDGSAQKQEVIKDTFPETNLSLSRDEESPWQPTPDPEYQLVPPDTSIAWRTIDTGLVWAEIPAPYRCNIGDSRLTVLRIDPERYDLELFCAGERGAYGYTAEEWAAAEDLIAVFNAGMFQSDGLTNVGYLQSGDYVNNSRLHPDYRIVAAFDPVGEGTPPFQLIDLECQSWDDWKDRYRSFTQCIRMISCRGQNVWSRQERYWSMVAIAQDRGGQVLFCFARSPYSVWQFNQMLLQLPLNIDRAMYLEGGPEASFYVKHQNVEIGKMGSYETGFNEDDENDRFWTLPNVIGVRERD